jgi:plastocyanin
MTFTAVTGAIALAVAGIGPAGAQKPQRKSLRAVESGGLSFSKKKLSARPGRVRIVMRNPSGNNLPHAIGVEGGSVDKHGKTVQPGGTSRVTVRLRAGKYTFYCPVGEHEQAGMKGTLTVSG